MRPTTYQSFMLRLECVEQVGEHMCWQSEVKHIQSGAEYRFDNVDGLLDFLRRRTETTPPQSAEGET